MNKTFSIFIIALLVSVINGQDILPSRKLTEREMHRAIRKNRHLKQSYNTNYDIKYHRIYWNVDPAEQFISGNVYTLFSATENGARQISLDLSNNLKVDSITSNSTKLPFVHNSDILIITLSRNLSKNELDSITIFYRGKPTEKGDIFFTGENLDKSLELWTLSEPFGAKEWWPCKQSLNDKIDSIDIFVNAPSNYKVASNGILVSETVENGNKVTHWEHRHPITAYLIAIAVSEYSAYSHWAKYNGTDSVEILNYVYPDRIDIKKEKTKKTVDLLELYSKLFIPYPFSDEKYGHAEFGWGGGMEHQTMSFMGGFSFGLIAHELAHQWFGNHVTCGTWKDIWVNEGFAVYCEGLAYEHLYPEFWHEWKKMEVETIVKKAKSGSIYVDDTSSVNRIFNYYLTYIKGGMVVHMLRNTVGDTAFFEGINQLLVSDKTAGHYATGEDVKTFLEAAADTNLTTFFDNWYYGQGYPEYSINLHQANADSVRFTLSQTTSHASVDFFPMKVPIAFYGQNDTLLKVFANTKNNQFFSFSPGFDIIKIVFDPEYSIIAPHPANIILDGINKLEFESTINDSPHLSNRIIHSKAPFAINLDTIEFFDRSEKKPLENRQSHTHLYCSF